MNLWVIFFTGLTTGGLACLAVQGGLLTSVIANQKEQQIKDSKDWMPVIMFLLAKLISHAILGLFLGYLGGRLSLSLEVRLIFQIFTALFMFATAMNLLNVHPIFRFVLIQPPKFLQKIVRSSSKSKALFAPFFLGFLTIFVPCGVTQAMEVLAINSASPIQGALIMSAFVIGTSPLFAIIGVLTAKLSERWHDKFSKIASWLLIGMAIFSINGVLLVINSPITLQSISSPVTYFFSDDRFSKTQPSMIPIQNGVQEITIEALNNGYSPRYFSVKKGIPVKLTITTNDVYSCAAAFVFKEFGISTFLESTDSQSFTFTPNKKGKFTYSCSMGMYTGIMEVI